VGRPAKTFQDRKNSRFSKALEGGKRALDDAGRSSNISASPRRCHKVKNHFGVEDMTTQFIRTTTRLLCGLAVLLMIATAAVAQPATGTVKRLVLH
jgi:hypothetical protein